MKVEIGETVKFNLVLFCRQNRRYEVYGTSESGVNDERSDKKGRRCRILVVVT